MTIALEDTVKPRESVLYQQISGESVLLDMDSEQYFGLDEVGTRIWQLLTEHGRLADVYAALLDEYEVEPEQLRRDLLDLTALLAERRLIVVEGTPRDTGAAVDAA
jgi:hypothetical protein